MPSTTAFNHAVVLFFEKWGGGGNPTLSKFVDNLKKEWIDKNNGWYEGFTEGNILSTDNGLESVNGKYKKIKYFEAVGLIKLNKDNWAKIKCSCRWFLENYYFYHLKRGRKAKAKLKLQKNAYLN